MYKIINITYNIYNSNTISRSLFEKLLFSSECDYKGTLEMRLEPGHNLIQKGPFIIPFVRWIDSFEDDAEFDVICDVQQVLQ